MTASEFPPDGDGKAIEGAMESSETEDEAIDDSDSQPAFGNGAISRNDALAPSLMAADQNRNPDERKASTAPESTAFEAKDEKPVDRAVQSGAIVQQRNEYDENKYADNDNEKEANDGANRNKRKERGDGVDEATEEKTEFKKQSMYLFEF